MTQESSKLLVMLVSQKVINARIVRFCYRIILSGSTTAYYKRYINYKYTEIHVWH